MRIRWAVEKEGLTVGDTRAHPQGYWQKVEKPETPESPVIIGLSGGAKVKAEYTDRAFAAEVIEISGKVGTRQGGSQVRVKILEGSDQGKVLRRNVLGPIRAGDILMLKETEIEASPLKGRRR